jgi:TniQ
VHDLASASTLWREAEGPLVPATPLFGIPPRGAGTGEVESLFSHLLTLSFEQRLAPRQVVSHVLPGVEGKLGVQAMSPRYQVGWAWDKHAGREMVGMHRSAARWVRVMEAATGLSGLRFSTLLPLEPLTTGNLVTSEERVCLDCLAADEADGQMPYGRLLWRLRPATCCPKHRKRRVLPRCGRTGRVAASDYGRIKLSGVCGSCGSIGHGCRKDEPEEAGPEEVWRAEQCLRVLAALPSIEKSGPAPVRAAVRTLCSERGAVCSLALRAGAPKSVLTQWLKHQGWRLSFEQLLDICAVEELDLAELLQGRLVASPCAAELAPLRVRRRRDPVDHEAIRSALAQALTEDRSVTDVAKALRVDLATLAKHRDLYVPVREATARRNAEAEEARHQAAIQKVEAMACNLANRGKRLTHRNALREGSNRFAPSSVESVVLSVMRTALGDRRAKGPAGAAKLGPRYLQRISEAAGRLRPEIGEAQMPLPFRGD